jgi:hypothetical protein
VVASAVFMGVVWRKPAVGLAAIALAAPFAAGAPASSQTAVEAPPAIVEAGDQWRLRAATYGWLMSVDGNVTAKGQTVDVGASFIDLLQKSESLIGYMAYFEADKGRVGFFADAVFARLGFASSTLNYRTPVAGLNVSTAAKAGATYSMAIIEAAGTYQLHRWPGSSAGTATALDVLAGFRLWNQSIDLNLDIVGSAEFSRLGVQRGASTAIASTGSLTWVDPVIGLRVRHQLTARQDIVVLGDIGGFGLQSNLTWQAFAGYNAAWQFTGYQLAAVVGFRALGVDYSSGAGTTVNGVNLVLYGPIIGGSIRF